MYRRQQLSHSTKSQVRIIEHGADFDASLKEAFRIAQTEGRSLVHPFDDPHVIAGNGTVGMEILKAVGRRWYPALKTLQTESADDFVWYRAVALALESRRRPDTGRMRSSRRLAAAV